MRAILESPEVEKLETLVEEATRSTEEGVKRFVEPAQGTLRRATTQRNHIVFGRRGSGKSSLLRKAAADLTIDRRPIAYVDLETFKGHSYPDVLISVLIETFAGFAKWLDTAAINPKSKKSFWEKLFGRTPERPPMGRRQAQELAQILKGKVLELKEHLHAEDESHVEAVLRSSKERQVGGDSGVQAGIAAFSVAGKAQSASSHSRTEEIKEEYKRSKLNFLHRHIQEYQEIFRSMKALSEGDSFLFLDDLYHIRRVDQASVIDYFHRIAKNSGLWLKIGTIRHRTRWYMAGDPPIGVKIGDDADEIDLDLTLEKFSLAKKFLVTILATFVRDAGIAKHGEILADGALDRLVLASGGVARDFLGIFRRSISVARERGGGARGPKIGAEDVNSAAGEYDTSKREEFRRDTLDDQEILEKQFGNIREFCARYAKTNVFLLDKEAPKKHVALVEELVDLRLLHKVRSRVTVSDHPGDIFEAYMLDVSQYTASRKMKELEMVEFWRKDAKERLRRTSLIYDPEANYKDLVEKKTERLAAEKDKKNPAVSQKKSALPLQGKLFPEN